MNVIQKYKAKAEEFAKTSADYYDDYGYEPTEHIINIIASVMMTRDGVGYPGGSFVQSVVKNDLVGAISRADVECSKYLRLIVSAKEHARV